MSLYDIAAGLKPLDLGQTLGRLDAMQANRLQSDALRAQLAAGAGTSRPVDITSDRDFPSREGKADLAFVQGGTAELQPDDPDLLVSLGSRGAMVNTSGAWLRQASTASGQRSANAQPTGKSTKSGTLPAMVVKRVPRARPKRGLAANKPWV